MYHFHLFSSSCSSSVHFLISSHFYFTLFLSTIQIHLHNSQFVFIFFLLSISRLVLKATLILSSMRWVNKKNRRRRWKRRHKKRFTEEVFFFVDSHSFIWEVSTLFNTFQFTFICSNERNLKISIYSSSKCERRRSANCLITKKDNHHRRLDHHRIYLELNRRGKNIKNWYLVCPSSDIRHVWDPEKKRKRIEEQKLFPYRKKNSLSRSKLLTIIFVSSSFLGFLLRNFFVGRWWDPHEKCLDIFIQLDFDHLKKVKKCQ